MVHPVHFTQIAVLYEGGRTLVIQMEAHPMGRGETYPVRRNQPLNGVSLLHQRRLVHGPYPAVHVLLCVCAEEIRPHPAVFRL